MSVRLTVEEVTLSVARHTTLMMTVICIVFAEEPLCFLGIAEELSINV